MFDEVVLYYFPFMYKKPHIVIVLKRQLDNATQWNWNAYMTKL